MLLEHVFGSFGLQIDTEHSVKRIVLTNREGEVKLPYSVWSAGQREFVPLLLGLYWLLPPNRMRRNALEWVVIEEPEMGLHPRAISTLLALILELLARGYNICISTHSPHILDIVWALQIMQKHQGTAQDVLDMLHLSVDQETRKLALSTLAKGSKVYFFKRDGNVIDISGLDPGSEHGDEAGWGGLTEFSANVGDVVARVVNRSTRDSMTFQLAIAHSVGMRHAFQPGLHALGTNSRVVNCDNTCRITGSVDLDTVLREVYPNDHRWD